MAKALKLWNGRPSGVFPSAESRGAHIYVAAYSAADARRVCVEAGQRDPGANEVANYWHAGAWGTSMQGITPERGLWVVRDRNSGGQPERLPLKDEPASKPIIPAPAPKKRGAPFKPPAEVKSARIEVNTTQQNRAAWQAKADKAGLSLNAWIGSVCNKET